MSTSISFAYDWHLRKCSVLRYQGIRFPLISVDCCTFSHSVFYHAYQCVVFWSFCLFGQEASRWFQQLLAGPPATCSVVVIRWMPKGKINVNCLLGFVERNSSKLRVFIMIKDTVGQCTTIQTDQWQAYAKLDNEGYYIHEEANHTQTFVHSDTSAHIQTIEYQWRVLKEISVVVLNSFSFLLYTINIS